MPGITIEGPITIDGPITIFTPKPDRSIGGPIITVSSRMNNLDAGFTSDGQTLYLGGYDSALRGTVTTTTTLTAATPESPPRFESSDVNHTAYNNAITDTGAMTVTGDYVLAGGALDKLRPDFSSLTADTAAYLYKFDRNGNTVWRKGFYGGGDSRATRVVALYGNEYTTNTYMRWSIQISSNTTLEFLSKMDANGSFIWHSRFVYADDPSRVRWGDVRIAGPNEDIFVSPGRSSNDFTNESLPTFCIDGATGTEKWAKDFEWAAISESGSYNEDTCSTSTIAPSFNAKKILVAAGRNSSPYIRRPTVNITENTAYSNKRLRTPGIYFNILDSDGSAVSNAGWNLTFTGYVNDTTTRTYALPGRQLVSFSDSTRTQSSSYIGSDFPTIGEITANTLTPTFFDESVCGAITNSGTIFLSCMMTGMMQNINPRLEYDRTVLGYQNLGIGDAINNAYWSTNPFNILVRLDPANPEIWGEGQYEVTWAKSIHIKGSNRDNAYFPRLKIKLLPANTARGNDELLLYGDLYQLDSTFKDTFYYKQTATGKEFLDYWYFANKQPGDSSSSPENLYSKMTAFKISMYGDELATPSPADGEANQLTASTGESLVIQNLMGMDCHVRSGVRKPGQSNDSQAPGWTYTSPTTLGKPRCQISETNALGTKYFVSSSSVQQVNIGTTLLNKVDPRQTSTTSGWVGELGSDGRVANTTPGIKYLYYPSKGNELIISPSYYNPTWL